MVGLLGYHFDSSAMIIWTPEHGQTTQSYNGSLQPGPPPPPPPPHPSTTMNTPQWTPLTNAIAGSPATTPSKSRLRIRLEPLLSWEHWQQAEQEPPPLLVVENLNDQPVSLK
ncbi:hypothetical protein SNOG_05218 [Parastagonospora nodorum SN15]|uniref:Uncharacterized protein n=1 Tax=Phaeosphaeria nodorum (strain SN15 / ATCC MYA-4574 / FGSC 10173) TaxID=321614 RepID=Q0USP6_PHANO|nr:hypothetical protein SNOG_05218 [Parastagonospora nodorum SN15]EAT87609.1 hypothetical protein SNOG_05218 [Parastagonospora nodorum SN15]